MPLPFDLDAEVVRLVSQKLVELPTYPGVALKLQALLSHPDWSLATLTRLVQSDQALATNALRAANSAFYPRATPVTTLQQAISRIGARELSNIAIAGTLGVKGNAPGTLAPLRKESWRASLVSSLVCQELASSRRVDPGEAFLAGLLHDFGETIAYGCFEALLEAHPETEPQHLASWQYLGQRYHVELGMAMAADWKLPEFVVEAVMRHSDEDVSDCRFPELIHLVAVCDRVTLRVLEAPSIEVASLAGITLSPAEAAQLTAFIPRIPEFLHAFDPQDSVAPAPPAPPSLVAPTPSVPRPSSHPVDVPVTVGKKGSPGFAYRAFEWSPGGLRLKGSHALPERHLVTLDFGHFSVIANVLSCTASDAGCLLEVKPFALDPRSAALWRDLGQPPRVNAA